ncbi:MAG: UDP-3-O-(3-hydroxymyristoyl)glucosamine N-acyltransferase [Planctomycetes bacterium]|nr:UDP-3-O-(3-hydroxymyristoyl)glucosamine N-acyltransferase [Planctomycetota bacterium]
MIERRDDERSRADGGFERPGFRLSDLALLAGCPVPDQDPLIRGAAGLDEAGPGEIAFARAGHATESLLASRAGALIVAPDAPAIGRPHLVHANPRWVFCLALGLLRPPEADRPGIHPSAQVGAGARLGRDVSIGPFALVEDGATIGAGVVIGPQVVVAAGASIGDGSRLEARVVVHGNVSIGARCHLHAGAVLGSEGFGFEVHDGRVQRMPHIGGVLLGDEVEIGVGSAVDRGTTGMTVIGSGTKIDNLVQIGHNARIGRSCIIAAQSGIAGSSTIGDGVVMGGRSAVADHAAIGAGARLGGASGVYSEVPAGGVYSGEPARPHREHLREVAALHRLPELLRELRRLEHRIRDLEDESPRRPDPG